MTDNRNEQAQVRAELFESIMTRNGYEVVPGRYGGEYNNDQIAIQISDDQSSLMLGLKSLNEDGSGQLDTMSLGSNMQLSDEWLDAVVACLDVNPETKVFADKIKIVKSHKSFTRGMVVINLLSKAISYIPIDFNTEE